MTRVLAFARRLRIALLMLSVLAFAAPAFESHACAPDPASAAAETVVDTASIQDADGCGDCGPACANGCCHAPHLATMPDPDLPRASSRFKAPTAWADAASPPAGRPDGPERPPRL